MPDMAGPPDGLLKGYVIVHPKWGSFTKEDYIRASRSADPVEETPDIEMPVEKGEFDLREYEVADINLFSDSHVPSVMLQQTEIKFNISCIRSMDCGNYVEFLIHPGKKLLAVRAADKDSKYALQWASGPKSEQESRSVGCRAFIGTIYEIFGWKPSYKYKLYGRIYREGKNSVCVFSNCDSSIYIKKEEFLSSEAGAGTGRLLNQSGKCVRAMAWSPGSSVGEAYYVEKSREELVRLTHDQWQTRLEGQMCCTSGERLKVTSYEKLRQFIKDELGELFEEVTE